MSLDGFSLNPLINELNDKLAGGRIDKICQPNKQDIYLYIRQPGSDIYFISFYKSSKSYGKYN